MLRVIGLLLLIPLFDIVLLVTVAIPFLGPLVTVALVVLTALVGMLLVRAEGRATLRQIQQRLAVGELPTDELIDGGLLIAAGAFFLTPGLVTDFVGLLLAVPFTRYPVRAATRRWVVQPYVDAKTGGFASGQVYVGGFPNDENGPTGPGPTGPDGGSGTGSSGGGSFDPDEATDVDFDDSDEN
ncbi:membrane protein FxsA [Haloarcula taiwanensis]|uniref:Membrane protein FxsA n=1 Tax=Haloarcula taiwanensis TaxID=1932004 RepID=A0A2H4ZVI4_9EURY|nr:MULTISPECIES: FxsA family protein [Haloarcula]AUG46486.1 membrane protein FxsA [Haloarcula taiwanensis]RLM36684.1 membrane protein FxsA [Haloarcula sp. Atlit-120R]RLM44929.1 membrane protein FxsA [Haloarcula sp. Atlit-47R]